MTSCLGLHFLFNIVYQEYTLFVVVSRLKCIHLHFLH